jgi:hypothetical protein
MADLNKTYTYDRNRVYKVLKGTQCSFAEEHVRGFSDAERLAASQQVIQKAIDLYKAEFGDIVWDCVEMLVSFVTFQVVVEFRVIEYGD